MGFCENFLWGVATAAFQIEGAVAEDGRGPSVWDIFTQEAGRIYDGHTADIACDHYHRWEEDIDLLAELGVKAYRFSLSWTRLFPEGTGEVNERGAAFYLKLIDALLARGIVPLVTLFHWDYPYALEEKGGWLNADSPLWFADYARKAAELFQGRVRNFITFNEPQCFIGLGYGSGVHAPGYQKPQRELVRMAHHVMLAHGLAAREIRSVIPDAKIGYAPAHMPPIPFSSQPCDVEAARQAYFDLPTTEGFTWSASFWSDPVILGRYPEETAGFAQLKAYLPDGWQNDLKVMAQPLDFHGLNIYRGKLTRAGEKGPEFVTKAPGCPKTAFNWAVTPDALYWGPKFVYERYGVPILITENGMSCHDAVSLDGKVHDPNRIDYTRRYLMALQKAADEGTDIRGYMHWSLLDNFEWAEGYKERFGLVYVDFTTGQRIKKDSFDWYKTVIQSNGEK